MSSRHSFPGSRNRVSGDVRGVFLSGRPAGGPNVDAVGHAWYTTAPVWLGQRPEQVVPHAQATNGDLTWGQSGLELFDSPGEEALFWRAGG
jgi:hypothetical protein